jgi:hypothetical protein
MTSSQNVACKRLTALGLPKEFCHAFLNKIEKWKKSEGPENTVKRLKTLKVAYLHKLAGKDFPKNSWIANTGSKPKGVFGYLWGLKNPQKAISALMVYTAEVSPKLTQKQVEKFVESVKAPLYLSEQLLCDKICDMATRALSKCLPDSRNAIRHFRTEKQDIREVWIPRKGPKFTGRGTMMYTPTTFLQAIRSDLMVESEAKSWFSFEMGVNGPQFADPLPAGRIGYNQEPGFKLRAIANPNPAFNFVLNPLKDKLLSLLTLIPEDYTHDQSCGVDNVQNMLRFNKVLASVDLSDATNLFPAYLQFKFLRELLPKFAGQIDLFQDLSQREWWDPHTKKYLKWNKGQPLGLGPSFPSFALAHHIVMRYVISEVDKGSTPMEDLYDSLSGKDLPKYKYAILGDDIVMSGEYYNKYISVMTDLGCKVSMDKTIVSSRLAEFASRVVTQKDIFVQNKWRKPSDRSFIDIARNLGTTRALSLLSPRQRKVAKLLLEVPREYGGLGFNPKGKPLEVRLSENQKIIDILNTERLGIPFVKSRANAWFYSSPSNPVYWDDGTRVYHKKSEAEQAVSQSKNKTPPGSSMLETVISALNVREEKFLEESAPQGWKPKVVDSDPRGRTSLDILEKKLRGPLRRKH